MRFFWMVLGAASTACSSAGSTPSSSTDATPEVSEVSQIPDVRAGDVATGGPCAFNRECAAADRCECIDFTCTCRKGPRGTGKAGVDTCTSGNDCVSSLCVEGSDGKSYCSDECETAARCGGALPRCLDVAGLGRICVREGP